MTLNPERLAILCRVRRNPTRLGQPTYYMLIKELVVMHRILLLNSLLLKIII